MRSAPMGPKQPEANEANWILYLGVYVGQSHHKTDCRKGRKTWPNSYHGSNLPWLEEMSLTTLKSSRILLSVSGEDEKWPQGGVGSWGHSHLWALEAGFYWSQQIISVMVSFRGKVASTHLKWRREWVCCVPSHSPFSSNVSVPLCFKNGPGQVEILTRFHTVLSPNVTKITFAFASVFNFIKHVSEWSYVRWW